MCRRRRNEPTLTFNTYLVVPLEGISNREKHDSRKTLKPHFEVQKAYIVTRPRLKQPLSRCLTVKLGVECHFPIRSGPRRIGSSSPQPTLYPTPSLQSQFTFVIPSITASLLAATALPRGWWTDTLTWIMTMPYPVGGLDILDGVFRGG